MDSITVNGKGVITIPFFRVGVAEIDVAAIQRVSSGKTIMVKGDPNGGRYA